MISNSYPEERKQYYIETRKYTVHNVLQGQHLATASAAFILNNRSAHGNPFQQ
jgi:hypothetical protein